MKKGKFIVLIAVALLVTRLPLLLHPFIDADEALFAVFARIWQHGGIPYVDAVETKAMGIYYFYALASWLSGSLPEINMTAVHLLGILWTGATAAVVGRIAARLSTPRAGLWAALLFILFSSFFIPKIVATSMEVVLLLPLCLAMDLVLRPANAIRPWMSLVTGALVSAAMIVKYQAGIMIPVILIYYWLFCFSRRQALGHTALAVIGGLPLPALMLWQLYGLNALPDFWFWNFGHSLHYIQTGAATIDLGRKLLSHALPFIAATALVWVLSAKRFKAWWRQGLQAWRRSPAETGIWIWFFLSIIPVVLGRRFYGHYFLLLMPQLCILSALQWASLSQACQRRLRPWVLAAILIPLVATTIPRYHMRPFYAVLHEEFIDDYRPYGEFLKRRTSPQDRVLVWGFSPAVYWYAGRLPATRFLWSDLLAGRISGLQKDRQDPQQNTVPSSLWEMFWADLDRHRPVYIIDMAPTGMHDYERFPMSRYPALMAYIGKGYVPEADFMGAKVFRRKDLVSIPSSIP